MAPDLSLLIHRWKLRLEEQLADSRMWGPTFAGMEAHGQAQATRQCLDELLAALQGQPLGQPR